MEDVMSQIGAVTREIAEVEELAEMRKQENLLLAREPEVKRRRAVRSVTTEVIDAWSTALPAVPSIAELAAVVAQPLRRALPHVAAGPIPEDDKPVPDVLSEEFDATVAPELLLFCSVILTWERLGTTEETLHSLSDALVGHPLIMVARHAGVELRLNRNSVDLSATPAAAKPADFNVWLPSGVLAFKGEESADCSERHTAQRELTEKLAGWSPLFFGQLPYQLAYAMGGMEIQFFVLDVRNAGRCTPISDVFNLNTCRGRSLCLRTVVNIARVIVSLYRSFPDGGMLSLGSFSENANSRVHILASCVLKIAKRHSGKHLLELYAHLAAAPIPHLVRSSGRCYLKEDGRLRLQLMPFGISSRPAPHEALKAARCLLQALEALHRLGWVHRDIRTTNILRNVETQTFFLMDLEWANKADQPLGHYNPNRRFVPPELRSGKEVNHEAVWRTSADMWQVGCVFDEWNVLAGDLIHRLCCNDASARPSASAALLHQAFLE